MNCNFFLKLIGTSERDQFAINKLLSFLLIFLIKFFKSSNLFTSLILFFVLYPNPTLNLFFLSNSTVINLLL